MKTVLKYLLAGFLTIGVIGLGVSQVVQVLEMKNIKQTVEDLKTEVSSIQSGGLTVTPTENPDVALTSTPTGTVTPGQTMTIKLYYKNYTTDPNVDNCEADTYVERTIPKTLTPLTEAIKLLLKNDLTQAEKNLGLKTEFNTTLASKQLSLVSASITNGVATLKFDDPADFTSGGSCRSGILATSVSLTAKQFPSVTSVEFLPISVFQP